ncbi:MAG: hypothetical protein IIC73_08720, partial [Armatimonadetes bacterium]|nr:hypothetical protein [Armatimonadota bacterium]
MNIHQFVLYIKGGVEFDGFGSEVLNRGHDVERLRPVVVATGSHGRNPHVVAALPDGHQLHTAGFETFEYQLARV